MSVVYALALKNARLQLVSDRIAGKLPAASTGAATAGVLVIGTTALAGATGVLASIPLPLAPFVVAAGVATLQGVPLTANAVLTGTAAKAELRDHAGNVIVSGLTVGTAGTNITVADTAFVAGAPVFVIAGTITHG